MTRTRATAAIAAGAALCAALGVAGPVAPGELTASQVAGVTAASGVGSLDTSFSADGIAELGVSPLARPLDATTQPVPTGGRRIVVLGLGHDLVATTPDGTVDRSFDHDGALHLPDPDDETERDFGRVAAAPDGSLYVLRRGSDSDGAFIELLKRHADGAVDPAFADDGGPLRLGTFDDPVTDELGVPTYELDTAADVAVRADGSVIVVADGHVTESSTESSRTTRVTVVIAVSPRGEVRRVTPVTLEPASESDPDRVLEARRITLVPADGGVESLSIAARVFPLATGESFGATTIRLRPDLSLVKTFGDDGFDPRHDSSDDGGGVGRVVNTESSSSRHDHQVVAPASAHAPAVAFTSTPDAWTIAIWDEEGFAAGAVGPIDFPTALDDPLPVAMVVTDDRSASVLGTAVHTASGTRRVVRVAATLPEVILEEVGSSGEVTLVDDVTDPDRTTTVVAVVPWPGTGHVLVGEDTVASSYPLFRDASVGLLPLDASGAPPGDVAAARRRLGTALSPGAAARQNGTWEVPAADRGTAVAVRSDGRIVVGAALDNVSDGPSEYDLAADLQSGATVRLLPDGTGDGPHTLPPVRTPGGRLSSWVVDDVDEEPYRGPIRDVVLDGADGEVLAVTVRGSSPSAAGLVVRRLADGSPDPSFGAAEGGDAAGAVLLEIGEYGTTLDGVARTPAGHVIAVGVATDEATLPGEDIYDSSSYYYFDPGSVQALYVARLLPDGRLDETFGVDGTSRRTSDPDARDLSATGSDDVQYRVRVDGVAIDRLGRILVTGTAQRNTTGALGMFVARFLPSGAPDETFSTSGPLGVGVRFVDGAAAGHAVTTTDDGVLVAGRTDDGRGVVLRLADDGTVDGGFGSAGSTLPFGGVTSEATGLAVDDDGRVLVSGWATGEDAERADAAVARLLPDGVLDATFGVGGVTTVGDPWADERATDLALAPGGDVVATGWVTDDRSTRVLVLRLVGGSADETPEPPEPPTTPPADPALGASPPTTPVGGTIAVTGTNFGASSPVTLLVAGAPVASTTTDGRGAFVAQALVPVGTPGGPVEVAACQRCGAGDEARAATTVTVTPRLFVDPTIGRPGAAVTATGDGFPASTVVQLGWSLGLGRRTVLSDPDGTVVVPMVVFRNDVLGPRELTATLGLDTSEAEPVATTPFLAVPGSSQPGDFTVRR